MKPYAAALAFALILGSPLAHAQGASGFGAEALRANGTRMPGPNAPTTTSSSESDAKIDAENQRLERMVRSICKGC